MESISNTDIKARCGNTDHVRHDITYTSSYSFTHTDAMTHVFVYLAEDNYVLPGVNRC